MLNAHDAGRQSRRGFIGAAGAVAATLAILIMGGLPLARAREFDAGSTPVYGKALTARELRKGLGLGS